MDLQIRPMGPDDDLEQVAAWFDEIGREWLVDDPDGERTRGTSRAQLERWQRGDNGHSCILLAVVRNPGTTARETVGFAVCLLQRDPAGERLFGIINGIYVRPHHRGEHIGRRLKEAADDWCRRAGAAYMKAHIGIGNEAMLRVCKLLGYQPWMITMIRRFD